MSQRYLELYSPVLTSLTDVYVIMVKLGSDQHSSKDFQNYVDHGHETRCMTGSIKGIVSITAMADEATVSSCSSFQYSRQSSGLP